MAGLVGLISAPLPWRTGPCGSVRQVKVAQVVQMALEVGACQKTSGLNYWQDLASLAAVAGRSRPKFTECDCAASN